MIDDICPHFNTCFISSMLKAIEVPHVLQYCFRNYGSCRYRPRREQEALSTEKVEEASA